MMKNGRRIGVECKRADAPAIIRSMRVAQQDLKLDHLHIHYPRNKRYELDENVTVEPLTSLAGD